MKEVAEIVQLSSKVKVQRREINTGYSASLTGSVDASFSASSSEKTARSGSSEMRPLKDEAGLDEVSKAKSEVSLLPFVRVRKRDLRDERSGLGERGVEDV